MRSVYALFLVALLALTMGCQTTSEEIPQEEEPIEIPEELPLQGFSVNTEFIPQQDIDVILAQQRAQGMTSTEEEVRQYIIETTVLMQEAQRRGIMVTTEEIEDRLQRDSAGLALLTQQEYEMVIEQERQERTFLLLGLQLVEQPSQELVEQTTLLYEEVLRELGYSEEEIQQEVLIYLMREEALLEAYNLQQELLTEVSVVVFP